MNVKPFVERFIQETKESGFSIQDAEKLALDVADAALKEAAMPILNELMKSALSEALKPALEETAKAVSEIKERADGIAADVSAIKSAIAPVKEKKRDA